MKKFLLILFINLIFVCSAYANDDVLLKEVENNYKKMDNFKAEFKQELFHRESNTTQKRTGFIEFMPPTFIHWETKAPNRELIICNSKEVWNYLPDEELAYRYHTKVLDESHAVLSVITGQARIKDTFEIEPLESKEKNIQKFTLYPLESNPQMVEVTLSIDTKTKLIKKVKVLDFFGNLNTIEFTNFSKNTSIDKKDFQINLPKNVEIEDHYKK